MYLIKITATATPANKRHLGEVKVWYQGRGITWEDFPHRLQGRTWKYQRAASTAIAQIAARFAPFDDFWGMWVHSLEIIEVG